MINSIKRVCKIIECNVFTDGKLSKEFPASLFNQLADNIYQYYQTEYPKFHKMDNLSKLGFLTAEVLLKGLTLTEKFNNYRIGVILSNNSSSLDTDLKYFNTTKRGIANPAVFVYTLPNIMIGEICIRNGIKGENTFFVSDKYEIHLQVSYVNSLLNTSVVDACICGWVELINETYESFLYLVVKGEDNNQLQHTTENIEILYNQISN